MPQFQFLLDGETQKVAFRELKNNAAQRSSLPLRQRIALPADGSVRHAARPLMTSRRLVFPDPLAPAINTGRPADALSWMPFRIGSTDVAGA